MPPPLLSQTAWGGVSGWQGHKGRAGLAQPHVATQPAYPQLLQLP